MADENKDWKTTRRGFLKAAGASGIALSVARLEAQRKRQKRNKREKTAPLPQFLPEGHAVAVPDEGWRMWPDQKAQWRDDTIYLPEDVRLDELPVNPPTGGWEVLKDDLGTGLTLPSTVEQYYWGIDGFRSYKNEYKFETTDNEVKNGNYLGVSWWWRSVEIPEEFRGKQMILHIRGARQRAEVYLNRKLVGYSILEELPFACDITKAARPGAGNELAIRITNPGGEMDWVDRGMLQWGMVRFQRSHGFGGLDRALRISAHDAVRVEDSWALNTPDLRQVTAFAIVRNSSQRAASGNLVFRVIDPASGHAVATQTQAVRAEAGKNLRVSADLIYTGAKLWDVNEPNLYVLHTEWLADDQSSRDERRLEFGFRWFAPDGVGTNAMFRLNGRRTRIYTAISWGFWGLNGLWPTPELARREVEAAQTFHLNCLNFHRNVGREEVFALQDRMGLLRNMEPGGGIQAVAPSRHAEEHTFAQRYMQAKIVGMIRAFRSHPSLTEYILQNEASFDLHDPSLYQALQMMREEDPSRTIVANDGFVSRSGQAWLEPYSNHVRTSLDGGAGGWWDDHKGPFSDVWNDVYYKSPEDFLYRSTDATEIVEWGEMKGAASIDNHALLIRQIERHGGKSYDLKDHQEILAAYETFLDRFDFRASFPTASGLFESISKRAYESWGQFLENIRICDVNDYATISGWESTAIEDHSGLVDNMRDFKSNPTPLAKSLLPVRPVAKQKHLVLKTGDAAGFDLYLLNDTGKPLTGKLHFSMTDPTGKTTRIGNYDVPEFAKDTLSYLVQRDVTSGPLTIQGVWKSRLQLNGAEQSVHECELWVVDPAPQSLSGRKVGIAGGSERVSEMLRKIPGVIASPFMPGGTYDVIVVADEPVPGEAAIGTDATGAYKRKKTEKPAPKPLPKGVLDALKAGTPVLALTSEDGAAEGYAQELSQAGAFQYAGLVGPSRASWMGSWYFVREHALFSGMPVKTGMSIHYQVKGSDSNGWLVEGPGVEIVAGYSRDHDRNIGAGVFAGRCGRGQFVMSRIAEMHPVLEQRFAANCIAWLTRGSR